MLERGEQRPWSPADLIGVPRELRSNGERRSDGALYFGMPKSFSEVRDDEGYQPLRPKCRMRSTAVPLRNAQSPQEQIVRSEAKISTVSLENYFVHKRRLNKLLYPMRNPRCICPKIECRPTCFLVGFLVIQTNAFYR